MQKKSDAPGLRLEDALTKKELLSGGISTFTMSLASMVVTVFMSFYYTDIVGISAAAVGSIMMVVRVLDAFTDIGMGILIDRTRSRFGKARPWLLIGALPLMLSVVLAFSIPQGWSAAAKTAYAAVTYGVMLAGAFTVSGVSGSVLSTYMTSHQPSREKSSVISAAVTMAASIISVAAVQALTKEGTPAGWTVMAVIFGAAACAGQLVHFCLCRERISRPREKSKKQPGLQQLKVILGNKYCLIMLAITLFAGIENGLSGANIYYCTAVLERPELMTVYGTVNMLSMLAGIAAVPIIAKRTGIKPLLLAAVAVKIASLALLTVFARSIPLFLVLSVIRSLAGCPMMIYSGVLLLATIEYGQRCTGVRADSLTVTLNGFFSKVGSGVGNAAVGWLLALGGYAVGAVMQGAAAQNMIIIMMFVVPLVMLIVQLVLTAFYSPKKVNG